MDHSILIAADPSENALRAVDYVGRVMHCHSNVRITLLNVIKGPSPDILPDEDEREVYVQRKRSEMLAMLEEISRRLTAFGIEGTKMCFKTEVCSENASIAQRILQEHQEGGYDTIVVGRRGMSKKEEFLFGSVSSKVVREARNCTVWVVE